MADLNLFTGECCAVLTPKQLKSLRQACVDGTVVDTSCSRESVNTCGMSIDELFNTYPIYNPQKGLYKSWGDIEFPWEISDLTPNLLPSQTDDMWKVVTYRAVVAYPVGSRVLYIEEDGYRVSLYEANQSVSGVSWAFDYSKWDKVCQVETTAPAGLPSIEELLERFGLYSAGVFDKEGDMFIAYGACEDTLCLYITTEDLPTTPESIELYRKFDPGAGVWQKFYCVSTGRNKCLEYQRRKEPAEGYDVIEIGSQGHYVEAPKAYKLKPQEEELLTKSSSISPRILTQNEIDVLDGTLPPECLKS
jgi:hypothetical protein